jgi:hypothetical protein
MLISLLLFCIFFLQISLFRTFAKRARFQLPLSHLVQQFKEFFYFWMCFSIISIYSLFFQLLIYTRAFIIQCIITESTTALPYLNKLLSYEYVVTCTISWLHRPLDFSAIEFCIFGDLIYLYSSIVIYAILYLRWIDVNKNSWNIRDESID